MSTLSDWLGPLGRRAPVPIHLLAIGAIPSAVAAGLVWLAYGIKLLAIPLVLLLATQGRWFVAGGSAVLLVALAVVQHRRPRSCAEPLRDEAVFLFGVALLAATEISIGEALLAGGTGVVAGVLIAAAIAALMYLTWGTDPAFVEMRRRTLRILGDNPDALTAIARVRVGEGSGLLLTLPHAARGPITLAVNKPSMKVVASVPWRDLRGPLVEQDQVTVFLGTDDGAAPDSDFQIQVPAGRYIVSVRNYRPVDRERLPQIRRVGAA